MGAVFLAVPGGHGLFLRCAARTARDAVSDELSDGRAAVRCARALVGAAFMGGGRRLRRGGVRARDAGLCRGDAGLFAVFLVRGSGLLRCGADGCDAHRLCDPEFYVLCSGSHRAAPAFYVRLRYALQPEQHHAVVCAAPTPVPGLLQGGFRVATDWAERDGMYYMELNPQLEGWGYLGALAALGLVFALCAFLLLKHREMERSGDVIAVGWLRPVALYVFTIGMDSVKRNIKSG